MSKWVELQYKGREKGQRDIYQVENCEVSLSLDLCVSQCVFPSLDNIAEG